MGLLVAYSAAMHRVLLALECQEIFEDDANRSSQEEPCSQDENASPSRAAGRCPSTTERFSLLSQRLKTQCGCPSMSVDDIVAKCLGPDGEFYRHALAVNDAVNLCCSKSGEYDPLDEYEENERYSAALQAAQQRFSRGQVSAGELKRPKTLEMIILATAHRIATRMRAAEVRKP